MLLTITTTGKITLVIVAGLFIAWALITAMWIPKRNPDFPATLTGFVLASVVFFAMQMGAIYWVTDTQEVEAEAAPAETTTTGGETTTGGATTGETTTTGGATTGATTTTGGAAGGGNAEAGKAVFTSAGCVSCHTLADAGATGTVGPNLDDAKPPEALVIDRVTHGKGVMPPFKGQLSDQQIKDVAAYVSSVAGKS
jgi:mono/diheme cytochrome c family protein